MRTRFIWLLSLAMITAILSFSDVKAQTYGCPSDNDKMIIKTQKGDILINNICKKPEEERKSDSLYDAEFLVTEDYGVSYFNERAGESFNIGLMSVDIQTARDKAEKAFLNALGIDKKKACLLKVHLGVPNFINNKASAVNHGLSFCPNGRKFSAEALKEAKRMMKFK